jgi:glucan phosphoethanolaminetransferase (alkaline phosphatase superfamily)
MINLNVIPNVNEIDAREKNANGGLLAQLIMFYIGIAAFVLVCCIPPFTIFLPFMIPMIILIVIFVNLAYFGKFLDRAGKKFQSLVDKTESMYDSTTTTLSGNLESRVQNAEQNVAS